MGDRNRSRYGYGYGRGQRDGPWRPPLPPPEQAVPLWEREFCSYVGNISWQRFCENKKYVWIFNNLQNWDDSGAFENFQNAKSRFWANYHGQPSNNLALPDPDMYIDEVDHHCTVDAELAADVEKVLLPIPTDVLDFDYSSIQVTGWVNAWEDKNCTVNQYAGNSAEKPAQVLDWGWEPNHGSNATWGGGNNESSGNWVGDNSGWRAAAPEKPSWGSLSNNQYAANNIFGGSNNNSRYFNQRKNKQKGRHEGFQRSSRQDHPSRGKKMEWRPVVKSATQQDGQGIEGGS